MFSSTTEITEHTEIAEKRCRIFCSVPSVCSVVDPE
jgi:hypothetical protein